MLKLITKHPDFTGREAVLKFLTKELIVDRGKWDPRTPVKVRLLWGLAGMGKSETAIAFANHHLFDFSFVWTIDCGKDLIFQYQLLGERLGVDLKGALPEHIPDKVRAFLSTNKFEQPWLLIYDNVGKTFLQRDFPERGGMVLLTSKQESAWLREKEQWQVEPLTLNEAVRLLTDITKEPKSREMELLAKELDCFPFALAQVARYIKHTYTSSIEKYRRIYDLKKQATEAPVRGDSRYEYILKNVWATTFDKIESESPDALKWLDLCSHLYSKNIPVSWLELWTNDEANSEKVFNAIRDYALVRFDRDDNCFSLHGLLQLAIQNRQEKNKLDCFKKAFYFLKEIGKDAEQDDPIETSWNLTSITREWLTHLFYLFNKNQNINHIGEKDKIQTIKALTNYAMYNLTEVKFGIYFAQLGIDIARKIEDLQGEGIFHERLGDTYAQMLDFKEAEKSYRNELHVNQALFGENSVQVAKSKTFIAYFSSHLGRLNNNKVEIQEAIENLESCKSVLNQNKLGERYYAYALSFIGHALAYLAEIEEDGLKKRELQEKCLQNNKEALSLFEKERQSNDPDLTMAQRLLSENLIKLERYQEAKKYVKKALQGSDGAHQNTLSTGYFRVTLGKIYNGLAFSNETVNEKNEWLKQAEQELLQGLDIIKLHTCENLIIAEAFLELGKNYKEQGEKVLALDYLQRALEIRKKYFTKQKSVQIQEVLAIIETL